MQAKLYAELPKKTRVLHKEGCWEQASWDVFPTRNITQLWKGPGVVPVPTQVVSPFATWGGAVFFGEMGMPFTGDTARLHPGF
jgi:hypothetical protein